VGFGHPVSPDGLPGDKSFLLAYRPLRLIDGVRQCLAEEISGRLLKGRGPE